MAVQHGRKAVLKLNDGSSLRDVSAYLTQAGLNRLKELAETTTIGGSTDKTYIAGLKDATIPFDGNYDPTADDYFSTMYDNDASAAFEYYPYGTTAGNIKYTGSFLLSSLDIDTSVGDKGSISGEIQVTGGVTKGTAA